MKAIACHKATSATLMDKRAFSHSRLETLGDCPRRYRFRYVEGLKEAFQTLEAFVGSMVHGAIQWAYLEREAKREPDAAAVVDRYHSAWRERMGPGVRVVRDGQTADQQRAEGEDMVRRHLATTFAEDRMETLAVEPRIDLAIGDHAYVGYIDRLARDREGTLHVIDYKTSRSVPESAEAAGLQARSYGVAVMEKHGGVEVGIRYEYLRHGKRVEERLPRSRSAEIAALIGARIEKALAAERLGDFPAKPGPLCRWCGFRDDCDASPFRILVSSAAAVQPTAVPIAVTAGAAPAPVTAPTASCPRCGSALVMRSGSRGDMVACARYPECGHRVTS